MGGFLSVAAPGASDVDGVGVEGIASRQTLPGKPAIAGWFADLHRVSQQYPHATYRWGIALNQSTLGHAQGRATAHDHMVKHANIDKRQRGLDGLR